MTGTGSTAGATTRTSAGDEREEERGGEGEARCDDDEGDREEGDGLTRLA